MSLEALFTKETKVTYKDVDFHIKELTLEHVPLVAHLVEKFLGEKGDTKTKMASILRTDTEVIRRLISLMAGINKEDINKLPIDVIAFLASKIINSNIEYIKKNVLPMAQEVVSEAAK